VVAHLPAPTRYAAATATDRGVVIAGGSIGPAASRALLRFDPATGRVMRIGTLPAPLTHAAAATLDGVAYVIGGRGAAPDTPSDAILAVDPATGAVRLAGRLPRPLSDAGAAAVAGHILVVGGRSAGTPIRDVYEVTPTARAGG
jgi:N-acetylneuraminic acid mutarotase